MIKQKQKNPRINGVSKVSYELENGKKNKSMRIVCNQVSEYIFGQLKSDSSKPHQIKSGYLNLVCCSNYKFDQGRTKITLQKSLQEYLLTEHNYTLVLAILSAIPNSALLVSPQTKQSIEMNKSTAKYQHRIFCKDKNGRITNSFEEASPPKPTWQRDYHQSHA